MQYQTPMLRLCVQEQPEGKLAAAWAKAQADSGLTTADIASGVGSLLAVKDTPELTNIKRAAFLGSRVIKDFLVAEIEGALDHPPVQTVHCCVCSLPGATSAVCVCTWTSTLLSPSRTPSQYMAAYIARHPQRHVQASLTRRRR